MPELCSEEEVMRKLADVLAVDPEAIERDTTSRDLIAWDSMGTMNVLFWLNAEFGIELGPNETTKLQSVRDILDLLSAAGKLS
jgi:acyl carrier protein